MKKMICSFCGNDSEEIYKLNGYTINQCSCCKTSFVVDMPDDEKITDYYNRFKIRLNENVKKRIISPKIDKWYHSLHLPSHAKMLDIGGGGGSFLWHLNIMDMVWQLILTLIHVLAKKSAYKG